MDFAPAVVSHVHISLYSILRLQLVEFGQNSHVMVVSSQLGNNLSFLRFNQDHFPKDWGKQKCFWHHHIVINALILQWIWEEQNNTTNTAIVWLWFISHTLEPVHFQLPGHSLQAEVDLEAGETEHQKFQILNLTIGYFWGWVFP